MDVSRFGIQHSSRAGRSALKTVCLADDASIARSNGMNVPRKCEPPNGFAFEAFERKRIDQCRTSGSLLAPWAKLNELG